MHYSEGTDVKLTKVGKTHALFESDNLIIGQGVGLGNDRYQIDFGMQAAHEFDVNLLQPIRSAYYVET